MENIENILCQGTILQGNEHSYRIDRALGQGSFGITYLAYTQVSVTGKLGEVSTEIPVAVKEFFMSGIDGREGSTVTHSSKDGVSEQYRRKFASEARNLGRMHHQGIVKVIETFDANGTSYYVMEYCSGGSLDALIASRGCLPEEEALRYFTRIADALAYMHDNKMLHLDLKPGNIMLRNTGEPVLIDFGLSKQYNEAGEPESSTSVGNGTQGYAPLEQANYKSGKDFPVTMDVYALGATLYKMLTGQRPPVASDVLIEFPEQQLREHGVSDNTIASIRRAMQAKPCDRYQSVADFVAELIPNAGAGDKTEIEIKYPPKVPLPIKDKEVVGSNDSNGNKKKLWLIVAAASVAGIVIGAVMFLILNHKGAEAVDTRSDTVGNLTEVPDYLVEATTPQQVDSVAPQVDAVEAAYEEEPAVVVESDNNRSQDNYVTPQREAELPEIEMVYVPGGVFTMGATAQIENYAWNDERPAHEVTLDGFYIGKYEVTQRLWKAVMGSNPSGHVGDDLPVEMVSWYDVQDFLRKLNAKTGKNYRLPTEAEWEYAARGGNRSRGYIFSGSDNLGSVAWYESNSGDQTHPVGAKSPNELGLYDMTGNVIEWTQDYYGSYSAESQVNPEVTTPPDDGSRVIKGGSKQSVDKGCHVSFRYGENPETVDGKQGFRLAL